MSDKKKPFDPAKRSRWADPDLRNLSDEELRRQGRDAEVTYRREVEEGSPNERKYREALEKLKKGERYRG